MDALNLSKNDRVIDGRRARSWWHQRAKEMIVEGATLTDVARYYKVTESAVRYAARGVHVSRRLSRGNYRQVNVRFNDEQMAKIEALAESRGKSFSAVVAGLVEEALGEESNSVFERCMK